MSVPMDEVTKALLALYADIDAEGGDHPDESVDFNEGFRVGLELALVKIDQFLNADKAPDEAWIAEGLSRLRSASPATPIGGLSLGDEGDQGVSVAGLPAHVADATATDAQHSAGKED